MNHACNARNERVGPAPVVSETTHWLHTVSFDVGFVPHVQSVPVGQAVEGRVRRIMTGANGIEVVLSDRERVGKVMRPPCAAERDIPAS